jgi:hypothetical protein
LNLGDARDDLSSDGQEDEDLNKRSTSSAEDQMNAKNEAAD